MWIQCVSRMDLLSLIKLPIYGLYNWRLTNQLRDRPLPQHVAVILDGNRRFARSRGFSSPSKGHLMGAEKIDRLLEWCDELAIPVVTVWALSLDNLHRDPKELDQLIEVIQHKLKDLAQTASPGPSARSVHVVGRLDALPDHVREAIADVETRTAQVGPFRLNIAVGYDGREEITEAVRNLLLERADQEISLKDVAEELTPEDITQRLYSKGEPDPDLIIRTSGELRLGGFMLWQSVHSELFFCDALWPAFRKVDFLRALRSYQQRDRRFGK